MFLYSPAKLSLPNIFGIFFSGDKITYHVINFRDMNDVIMFYRHNI